MPPITIDSLKALFDSYRVGYKYKVWFRGRSFAIRYFPETSTVLYLEQRPGDVRQYDPRYTVYKYLVSEHEIERVGETDFTSIVAAKRFIRDYNYEVSQCPA